MDSGGIVALVYVAGFFATPYVMARFSDYDDFCLWLPMLLWPIVGLFGLISLIGSAIYRLGER